MEKIEITQSWMGDTPLLTIKLTNDIDFQKQVKVFEGEYAEKLYSILCGPDLEVEGFTATSLTRKRNIIRPEVSEKLKNKIFFPEAPDMENKEIQDRMDKETSDYIAALTEAARKKIIEASEKDDEEDED